MLTLKERIRQGIYIHREITQWILTGKNYEEPSCRLAATVHHWPPVIYTTYATFRDPPICKMPCPLPEAPKQFDPITISARNPEHLRVNEAQMQVKLFKSDSVQFFPIWTKKSKTVVKYESLVQNSSKNQQSHIGKSLFGNWGLGTISLALGFTLWALGHLSILPLL